MKVETRAPSATQTVVRCICGNHDLVNLGRCRTPSIGPRGTELERELSEIVDPGNLYRCTVCHLGLRLPCPPKQLLAGLYENLPASRWKPGVLRGKGQQMLVRRFQHLKNQKVLDVGAFDGTFLNSLPDCFHKHAIEPSAAADSLQARGITVLRPFLDFPAPDEAGKFDIVTMFDVFEHLTDPLLGMQQLMQYVRPGGSLFVGTGNLDHWSWQYNAGNHWYLDPIQHVVVGSRKHFEWQAARLGATSVSVKSTSHHAGSRRQQWTQSLIAFYFGCRNTTGWKRQMTRIMNRFQPFRELAHKNYMPYTQELKDHVLVEFIRGGDA